MDTGTPSASTTTDSAPFPRAPSARNGRFFGVLVPMLTPFDQSFRPDLPRVADFAHQLLADGADGLAVFGTTSEGNSIGHRDRMAMLEHLVDAGIPPSCLMPGTGLCSLADTVELNRHATSLGCGGVLLLPPFYIKGPDEDGLFAFVAELIRQVGDDRQRIYLYHIPQMASVIYPHSLIARLLEAFPDIVVGIKDSSGDRDNLRQLIDGFPDLTVFPGSETLLLEGLRAGGAGCISATANINVAAIRALIDRWQALESAPDAAPDPGLDAMDAALKHTRASIDRGIAFIPALKAVIARRTGVADWQRACPPLVTLPPAATDALLGRLETIGFRDGRAPVPAPAPAPAE